MTAAASETPDDSGRSAIRYQIGGARVHVHVGDPELLAPLRLLFPSYEAIGAPRDRAAEPNPAIVVRRTGDRWIVEERGARHECESAVEVAEVVEYALTHAFLRCLPSVAHVHGAAARFPQGAVLLLGGEGAGKTSLSFWMSRQGLPVLGDDVIMVTPGGRAQAFKRLFKVDPTVLAEARVLPTATRLWEAGASTAWYDPTDGAGWVDEAPMAGVGLLRRGAGGRGSTRPISKAAALNALLHSLLATGLHEADAFAALAQALHNAVTFELQFSRASEGVAALQDLFP